MAGLKKIDLTGRITWLGFNADRDATLRSEAVEALELGFEGFAGESRAGLTRPSCSRVIDLYPRGTEIRNTRQLTILSVEELAIIAQRMGVDSFDPAWAGASMVVEGIKDFTHLPPSTRLQTPDGVTLTVDHGKRPLPPAGQGDRRRCAGQGA